MTKAFYRVELSPDTGDPNGTYQGVAFSDGYAYVDWRVLGEHETEVAIQALGHETRFHVTEILEGDLPKESAPKKTRRANNAKPQKAKEETPPADEAEEE